MYESSAFLLFQDYGVKILWSKQWHEQFEETP